MALNREFIRNAAKSSGVEIPKELEDILIQEHLSERDSYSEQQVKAALQNHKPDQPPKVEDTEEYKTLKQEFETYKADQQAKEIKAAKGNAAEGILKAAGLSGKMLDMAVKLYDLDSLELDENGKAKDFDNLVSAAKTEYAQTIPQAGNYTPPAGNGAKPQPKAHTLEEAVSAYYKQ